MVDPQLDIEVAQVMGPARLAYFTPIHHYPVLADRKATFLLGATGLMSTILLVFSANIQRLIEQRHVAITLLVLAMLPVVVGLLVFGAWTAYRGYVFPVPKMPPTLAYFPDIARTGRDDYATAIQAMDHTSALRAVLHYNYSLASQAAGKFRLVNRAFACFRVALVLWMLLLVIISVAG